MRQNIPHFESTFDRYNLLEELSLSPESKKRITKFVNYFSKNSLVVNCIKKAWEKEIKAVIPDKYGERHFPVSIVVQSEDTG